MSFFPSKIDNKTVKWYSDKGNYGKHMGDSTAYLAVVSSDNETELLFLDEYYRFAMRTPCESESDAMDIFDEPDAVTWHRMDADTPKQKRTDFLFFFYNIWHKEMSTVWLDFFFVSVICFMVGYSILPHYGNLALLSKGITYVGTFVGFIFLCLLFFRVAGRKNHKYISRLFLGLIGLIFLFETVIIGKGVIDICVDLNDEPVSIILTDTSYEEHTHTGYRTNYRTEYVRGICDGVQYSFEVRGINQSIANKIEELHPTIEVTYYKHSHAVKEIVALE